MSDFYDTRHRQLQDEFGSRELADGLEQAIVHSEFQPHEEAFISSRDMMFLTTIDQKMRPTVSHKGGDPGFVKVLNSSTLVFPSYDGNGMFLSMGNLDANPEVGMLFIDFEKPNRLRLQGRAEIVRDHPLMVAYPEAHFLIQVGVSQLWVNCPRYVHHYEKVAASPYVPRLGAETPIAAWKRIEGLQALLSEADQVLAKQTGYLTQEEYAANLANGVV